MIEIISATRLDAKSFWKKTPLGISLRHLAFDARLKSAIAVNNKNGLSEVYNERLKRSNQEILLFVHDDVWLDDFFLADHIIQGLQHYDVIGVAGNRRRTPYQPGWGFVIKDNKAVCDEKYLSGAVAHGKKPFSPVFYYGNSPAPCELLDGVFLAVVKAKLRTADVLFDPVFRFHFYDMDFCRTARQKGLRLGTWPIPITHQSHGSYGSQAWESMYYAYLKKWHN